MRIAIIGATGMLGHHAARAALARGHELTVIHRASSKLEGLKDLRFTSAIADLSDRASLSAALKGVDAVINAAAYYPTVPRPWREEVQTATAQMDNFYQACAGLPLKKIVYLGGAIALRKNPSGEPGDETCSYPGEPDNKNPYVQVKWAMDAQALAQAKAGLPVAVGIPTMTFGEYDVGPSTGRFIVELAKGTLPGYVQGRRNVIYAGDAGLGLVRVVEDGRVGERYLLTGYNTDMTELLGIMGRLSSKPVPQSNPLWLVRAVGAVQALRYRHLKGPVPVVSDTAVAVMSAGQHLSGAKAEKELGFKASVGVEDAITRALLWFRANGYC